MTHIVHPYSHRLGIIRDWKSRWFGTGKGYRTSLKVDVLLREYLAKKFRGMFVSGIDIERNQKTLRVIIKTSRPGMLIGRNGEGQVKLRQDILKQFARWGVKTKEELKIDVVEIRSPESNAAIVGQMVAESLEKRMPFRRVAKQMVEKVMANRDVLGVKIGLYGRLGGADMARREKIKKGRIPLQTFRADIDFAREKAHMSYGDIGIKVWIYKGDIFADKKPAAK
ncbi:MAG: 30S ribosomal protein S3 [Candidatus Pacebacteria bacterium]|nr:30S ribosomal protein S3 [Candidatus Paceibacterota bacterium]